MNSFVLHYYYKWKYFYKGEYYRISGKVFKIDRSEMFLKRICMFDLLKFMKDSCVCEWLV